MTETFPYNQYATECLQKSAIDPSVTHTVRVGFGCPRCRIVHSPGLEHAEGLVCECGLAVCLYGNGLSCATGGEGELRGALNLGPMAPPLVMREPKKPARVLHLVQSTEDDDDR